MKHFLPTPPKEFSVLAETERSQLATMSLDPDERVGDSENRHDAADQWVYVIAGSGRAVVGNNEAVPLEPGTVLLIEAGETHEIRNLDTGPLELLNFYAPPVY